MTEGGSQIGMGHVYRSITLAEELHADAISVFLTKRNEAVATIARSGFDVVVCKTDEEILGRLTQISPSVIVFDEPNLSARLIENTRASLGEETRIIVFDNYFAPDVNKRVDVVVNALVGEDFKNESVYDADADTQYYLGPKYLILRPEFFTRFEQRTRLDHPSEKRLLLFFGGADYSNLTTRMLDHVLRFDKEMRVHIIVGPAFGHFGELNAVIQSDKGERGRIKVDRDVTNVQELMSNADAIITSPGLSMFEALRLGKRAIAIYQNDYQRAVYKNFPIKCIIEQSDVSRIDSFVQGVDDYDEDDINKLEIGEGKTELLLAIKNFIQI